MKNIVQFFTAVSFIPGKLFGHWQKFIWIMLLMPFWVHGQTSTTQTIRGVIKDSESKQPIIGVSVVVLNTTPLIGTSTDLNGNFKLEKVPLGRHTLKITYLGYESLTLPDVMVTAGKEVILNITLTEAVTTMQEATVTVDRKKDRVMANNEMAIISTRSFNPDDTKKFAGALGDPSRMAANFAGVVSGNDSRNDIVVRGNSPNAMLWQMEGVNIPNPNHFGSSFNTGGPVSILNANNLGKSDFFTSAFPAQYGNANGGVFDLMLREGNNEKREYIAQVGFNGFEIGAEGPFSKKSKASFLFNYRYSTLALMRDIGLNPGTGAATPVYQDINFKVVVPTKGNGKIIWWGMGGMSSIDLLGKDVDTTELNFYGNKDQDTRPRYRMGVTGLSFEKNLSTKTWAKFTLAASQSRNYYTSDSIDIIADKTFRIGEGSFTDNKYSVVLNITHKINARNAIHFGANHDITELNYFNKDVFNRGTVDTIRVDRSNAVQLTQAYAQWKHRFGNRFTLNVGAHAQYFNINEQLVVEPRLGARYVLNEKSSLTLGYGLHHQLMPFYNIFVRNAQGEETNRKVKFMRSNHWVVGYELNVTKLWKLKTEVYYQLLDQVPVQSFPSSFSTLNVGADFVPSDANNLVNDGTGTNYGVELTVERYLDKGYYVLFTASVFDSKYKGSDGVERNTAFNTNYATNFLAGKEWKTQKKGNVWYGNIRITSVGGRYFTPLDLEASRLQGRAVYDVARAYSKKQDAYFRCDVKFGFRKDYKKSSLDFAIDIQNVTNHQNIFSEGYNKYNNSIAYQYQQGFFPVPTFRYTF